MRDKNLSLLNFEAELEKFITKRLQISKSLTTSVVVSTTRWDCILDETIIQYPRTFKEIEGLLIVLWYLPEELMWRIRLDLEERKFSEFNSKQRIEIGILLSSKENCLSYLFLSNRFTSNELFGNMVQTGLKVISSMKVTWKSRIVTKKVYRRGYNDKGCRRPLEKWLPGNDYFLTELQNQKERKLYLQHKTINRIIQYMSTILEKE